MKPTSTGTAAATTSVQRVAQTPGPTTAEPTSRHATPSHEEIAKLAYQLWEERGRPEGLGDEDWFRAENQLSQPKS